MSTLPLGREEMEVIDTGVARENLHLEVIPVRDDESKRGHLARLLREIAGTGIVYTSTVRDCDAVTAHLTALGLDVARYHGRLSTRERQRSQDRFMAGGLEAIVATNAFGMGIDKPDIRFVIHYNLPGSLESYYQEAGRAGRDGEPARCILLYQPEDRNTQLFFLNSRYPKAEHFAAVYRALERLKADREEAAVPDVQHRAAIALAKTRVVLATMKELGLVAEPEAESFRLVRPGLAPEELAELAQRYEERAERDRERLRRIVHYAQTALCRWKVLADYFGEEMAEPCGHCDNCERPLAEPLHSTPPLPLGARLAGITPLPPLLAGPDPAALQGGEQLTLAMYGRGKVRSIDGPLVVVELADGEVKEFRR